MHSFKHYKVLYQDRYVSINKIRYDRKRRTHVIVLDNNDGTLLNYMEYADKIVEPVNKPF